MTTSINSSEDKNNSFNFKKTKFKYTVVSVKFFDELQNDLDKLHRDENLSTHKNFRVYLDKMKFALPEDFPSAKYVILLVRETKLGLIDLNYKGKKHQIMISPGYFGSSKYGQNELIDYVKSNIIRSTDYRLEPVTGNLHIKSITVRSGLGRYGRNNLCYVDEMGSFIVIRAFLTDFDFNDETFFDMKLMAACENCRLCVTKCPTEAITGDNSPIDVDRCITLYNENLGELPEWIDHSVYNALFGCMRCQMYCPVNKDVMKNSHHLGELSEDETMVLLNGTKNSPLLDSISEKLQIPIAKHPDYYLSVIQRNLKMLLEKNC